MTPGLPARRRAGVRALACLVLLVAVAPTSAEAQRPPGARLAFEAGPETTRWSPVGVYGITTRGADLRPIVPLVASGVRWAIGAPSWSPDGRRIAFARMVGASPDVFVANADGTDERQVTSDPAWDYEPAWSPDGTRIAFLTNRFFDGMRSGAVVATVAPDGTGVERVTSERIVAGSPAWSPDGRWIAVSSTTGPAEGNSAIWLVSADGRVEHQVTPGPYDRDPSIRSASRHRLRIAYAARPTEEGDADVVQVGVRVRGHVRAGRPRRLVADVAHEIDPAWSPDGRRLAFARYQAEPAAWSRLVLRGARTSREVELLPAAAPGAGLVWFQSPAWAPCGRTAAAAGTGPPVC